MSQVLEIFVFSFFLSLHKGKQQAVRIYRGAYPEHGLVLESNYLEEMLFSFLNSLYLYLLAVFIMWE